MSSLSAHLKYSIRSIFSSTGSSVLLVGFFFFYQHSQPPLLNS